MDINTKTATNTIAATFAHFAKEQKIARKMSLYDRRKQCLSIR